jgi:hypothetical protein
VREHHIPTVSGEKYRIKVVDVSTATIRQRLRSEVLTIGTLDIRLDVIMIEQDKFDIILGQPWLQAVNPDIDWPTKRFATVKLVKLWCLATSTQYRWQYITRRQTRWHDC